MRQYIFSRRLFMKKSDFTILALVVCLFFLAACGGKTVQSQANSGGLEELGFQPSGYPIVTKPYTFSILCVKHDQTPDYNTLEIFQKLEQKTGVHINWEYAGADWSTQKALVLASGDLPDVFMSQTLGEGDIIENTELFLPLNELINSYGTNVRAMFKDDPGMENYARSLDGIIYGLPRKLPLQPDTYTVWGINKSWLDKLGLEVPATTEEFYQVLKAFKTQDPNGNGIADEIPLSCRWSADASGNRNFKDIFGAFGVDIGYNNWLSVTSGKVQYAPAQEGYKDAIVYLHRLYAEGLLDHESFTQDNNIYQSKTNPPAGNPEIIGVAAQWSRFACFQAHGVNYALMLPLKGPKGDQYWRQNSQIIAQNKNMFVITRDAKNPEIIFRWGDSLYEKITSLELRLGPLGKGFEELPDGRFRQLPIPSPSEWVWAISNYSPGYTSGATNGQFIAEGGDFEQYNDKLLLKPYFFKEYFPQVSYTTEEIDEMVILRQDIQSFATQKEAQWITEGGVEKEYDDFIRQLNTMGLARYVEIEQNAYDRYLGK
jgi:putative aldouronate transport system substrate-binding protein